MRCPYCGADVTVERVACETEDGEPIEDLWQTDCPDCGSTGPVRPDPDDAVAYHRKILDVLDAYGQAQELPAILTRPTLWQVLQLWWRGHP